VLDPAVLLLFNPEDFSLAMRLESSGSPDGDDIVLAEAVFVRFSREGELPFVTKPVSAPSEARARLPLVDGDGPKMSS